MTDSTDNALKPCPFCGSSEIEDVMRTGYLQCQYCLASAKNRTAWNRRADLAPDPLADPRVVALVEALRQIKMAKFEDGTWQCVAKRQAGIARAALAALSPTGGNADG